MKIEELVSSSRERATDRGDSGVGRSISKVDSRDKLTGHATYGSDLNPDGLLHGAVLRSTRPHARVVSVDTSAAAAVDGVHCAVARSELLGVFDDRVRHYGDVIAAVCAESEKTARRALQEIDYELEPLESIHDAHAAVRGEGPDIHENNPDLKQDGRHSFTVENDAYTSNIDDYHAYETGDVEAGFAKADFVLEGEYVTPRVNHCNLDTHCCIAKWEGETLTLTETLASLGRNQEMLAEMFGIEPDDIEIEMPPTLSSSFGGRSLPKLTLEPVAATLAQETDRPVKVWFDREEDFTAASTRHETHYELKMGITDAGDIIALDFTVITDTGGYPNGVGHIVLTNSGDRPPELYQIPNYRFEGVSVFTNNVPGGEYRGIGSTQTVFALESHIDELVGEAGLDPFEFRRRNFVRDPQKRPGIDEDTESGVMECLDRAVDQFRDVSVGSTTDPAMMYGRGFAAGVHTTGSGAIDEPDASDVELTLDADGVVRATTASGDHGQGSDTVMAQIIGQETGIPTTDISLRRFGTTEDLEDDLGSVASRSTYIIGGAVKEAAENLAAELRRRGAEQFDCASEAVSQDGTTVTGPEGQTATVTDLLAASEDDKITVAGRNESELNPPSHGVHFAEVAVDRVTGGVDILTYVAVQDVGFAINPKMVEGQLEGALQHGIEFALYSEVMLDEGIPENANLADYPAVSPYELPSRTVVDIVESNEESGPYGAKGIGTPAMAPIAPAILNAVRDATDYREYEPPLSNERLFTHLSDDA